MRDPYDFESAMSVLAYGIAGIERHPPVSVRDTARVKLLITRLETAANVAARKMENVR